MSAKEKLLESFYLGTLETSDKEDALTMGVMKPFWLRFFPKEDNCFDPLFPAGALAASKRNHLRADCHDECAQRDHSRGHSVFHPSGGVGSSYRVRANSGNILT